MPYAKYSDKDAYHKFKTSKKERANIRGRIFRLQEREKWLTDFMKFLKKDYPLLKLK